MTMKKLIPKILTVAFITIVISCSSDSENNNQNDMFLNKTEEFMPQLSGFTTRTVTYFENNKRIKDTVYDNSGAMTKHREYFYTVTTDMAFTYNAQNELVNKYIYTYDSAKRITKVVTLDGTEFMVGSREYEYIGHDINLYNTISGTPVLVAKFKTNSDNLIYYQSGATDEDLRTLSYNNDLPTQLDHDGLIMPYEFYPNMKPQNIQNTTNEINNTALLLVLDHIYFSCNYYLKKVSFPPINTTTHYERTFNQNNYQTYMKNFVDYDGEIQNNSETFFYYN